MKQMERKDSRRTGNTRSAIKNGMLSLLGKTAFHNISVSGLCRESGVGRATFYTHYTGLMEVIDELADEAILAAGRQDADSLTGIGLLSEKLPDMARASELEDYMDLLPVCQRVAHSPRYNALFHDDEISEYIIMRIYRQERVRTVPKIMKQMDLSEVQADRLFLFSVMGAFAVNRSMGWKKDDEWYEMQRLLLAYAHGGYEAVGRLCRKL